MALKEYDIRTPTSCRACFKAFAEQQDGLKVRAP
jgi:hypothetical protein